MRYQELRRPRGIESLWLRLRFAFARSRDGQPAAGDLSRLSDRQLEDIGLTRHDRPASAAFWRIGR
ncbi:MAG TPA: DUF1127 domain-containing protein [Microvirga sp.]|jgi:uncharacterized protein YjiS (DUF1127 family)|nr:DUF1127 domain-containing protein [Microvirga sp.]